jgi:2-oxoglutarate ferredoxin oxidoreductase subunit alpha
MNQGKQEPPGQPSVGVTTEDLEAVTIRFAGDSGDGIPVTRTQFTSTSTTIGNDIYTLLDFPVENREPAGSLPGVSGYQLNFSSRDIRTPGDEAQVLVAMNPAALKVNIKDLEPGGILVLNTDEFNDGNLKKAGYAANPLNDGSLSGYRVFQIPITSLTLKSLENSSLPFKQQERCKNFYALGLMYWFYDRPMEPTLKWIQEKFEAKPEVAEANVMALKSGYNYAKAVELFTAHIDKQSLLENVGAIATFDATIKEIKGTIATLHKTQEEIDILSEQTRKALAALQEV